MWFLLACFCLGPGVSAGQVANLSGNWHLNVAKSRYGSLKKPLSVYVQINHQEPALSYRGEVIYANEDSRDFAFDGAVDGKQYATARSYGVGTVVLRRLDDRTIESVFRSEDGKYVETARTTLSGDGKVMTRTRRVKSPEGSTRLTEVYDRR